VPVIPYAELHCTEHLVRRNSAELRVSRGAFDPEIAGVADGLCAPLGFERPLGYQELGRTTGLLFERGGDARDFFQSLFAIFHLTPL
jgi:hypothetical protein